jgi:hypothetical protein
VIVGENLQKVFTINVDTIKSLVGGSQNAAFSQGDVQTAILIINITESDTALDLTSKKIRASFRKSNGTSVYQDLTNGITVLNAVTGQIQVILNTDTLSSVGTVRGQLSITDEAGGLVAETVEFSFFVRESIINTAIISSENLPIVEQAIEAVEMLNGLNIEDLANMDARITENENQLLQKVTSANIKEIKSTSGIFEYTLDGGTWFQVQGGSGETSVPVSAAAEPVTGSYLVAQQILHSAPIAGGFVGWICIKAGTANNTPWVTGTVYAVNNVVYSGEKVYTCVTGGISGGTAPISEGTSVSDGVCVWSYVAPKALFKQFGAISL